MSGTLPTIKVTDVPENRANPLTALALVGQTEQRPTSTGGYVQVIVPLHFYNDGSKPTPEQLKDLGTPILAAYENGTLEQTLASIGMHTFVARWNVRPEWFDANYATVVKQGQVSETEAIQYRINMSNLTRGLFKAAGIEEIDFAAVPGTVVGFRARPRKDDPSRLDIGGFFVPKAAK